MGGMKEEESRRPGASCGIHGGYPILSGFSGVPPQVPAQSHLIRDFHRAHHLNVVQCRLQLRVSLLSVNFFIFWS